MRLRPYGDRGVLVELADASSARRLRDALRAAGVGDEHVVGWSSLLVVGPIDRLLDEIPSVEIGEEDPADPTLHLIDVVYEGEDLAEVAVAVGLEIEELIARHTAATYVVECLGFTRGFPYLSGLDPQLRLPRRETPRQRVPAGSVAMAADQVGIYPMESPGGWHLLGRTSLVTFDPERRPPGVLQPGDQVRFVRC